MSKDPELGASELHLVIQRRPLQGMVTCKGEQVQEVFVFKARTNVIHVTVV